MDDVYLLNNPFTFQAMEKHSAYCAMMRLGLKVPETWLIPHKSPPANERFQPTAERYNLPFDLEEIADRIGYPLYMKPFDGGQWVGCHADPRRDELHAVYDASGERLMHLQAAVEDFDVFARSLSIGAETMVMHFEPDRPMHDRYQVDHDFLSAEPGDEVVTISRLVNAFFRWEFNSCETIVKDGVASPIDYANASPDVALTSLHYYFPWAIRALVRWSAFCCATGRPMRINQTTRDYFEIGDREDLSYEEKLAEYRQARRRVLPGRRVRGVLRREARRTSTRRSSSTSRGRSSTGCSSTRCSRPSRRTSTSTSSPTTAACSRRGRTISADVRGAVAGIAAAAAWIAAEPVARRIFGTPFTDVRALGRPVSHRHWRAAGTAIHLANGAAAGIAFERLGLRGWKSRRRWPSRRAPRHVAADGRRRPLASRPPQRRVAAALRNRRVFAQEAAVHALFGACSARSSPATAENS